MTESPAANLGTASERALEVRALYETLEKRFTGRTWSLQELMIGYSNDVAQVGRLLLATNGTWPAEGDVTAQLRQKLSESLWWTFVLASQLGIDIDQAFTETMDSIESGLVETIDRTA